VSFHGETHSDRSNHRRTALDRSQAQDTEIHVPSLPASPRLDKKRRRPGPLTSFFAVAVAALTTGSFTTASDVFVKLNVWKKIQF
jgi:hypothetical protein